MENLGGGDPIGTDQKMLIWSETNKQTLTCVIEVHQKHVDNERENVTHSVEIHYHQRAACVVVEERAHHKGPEYYWNGFYQIPWIQMKD